jgi:xanthine dehydrogenase YagT iron-sulfur-binding subunit
MDANCLVGSACVRADPFTQGDAPMHFTINGEAIEVAADIRTSLLDLLRNSLGFTGTKKGCDQGACGACTILVDGERINACLALAVQYQGRDIMTVEGLARDGNLHPLQQAFIEHDGFQCGYCTPGQLCSAIGMASEIERNIPSVVTKDLAASTIDMDDTEIRERMSLIPRRRWEPAASAKLASPASVPRWQTPSTMRPASAFATCPSPWTS